MGRLWAFVLVLLSVVTFSSLAFAGAEALKVNIIPAIDNKIISANSNLVIKVDPEISVAPLRITWSVYNMGEIGMGSFPIVGGKGVCYFSDTDGNATCGPSPFLQAGETELSVFLVVPGTTTTAINKSVELNISSVSIDVSEVDREDNIVYMVFYMPQKTSMTYAIYKEDLTSYKPPSELVYKGPPLSRYEGNITLNPGVYYFAFMVNDLGNYGTALKRIEIPSADFLTVQTDRKEYWKGAKIRISGSSSRSVVGEVRFPSGSKAADFTADVAADKTYYYDLDSAASWPEGTYEIRTTQPLVKTASFNITKFLEVNPASVSGTLNKSDDFSASLTLKNTGQNATNVSFAVSGGLMEQHVTIANKTLAPQQSTTVAIAIPDVESSIDGKITLKTSDGLELEIPVKVTVFEAGQQVCPECPVAGKALAIDQYSLVWSQECVTDETISYTVTINNNGASSLSNFQYEIDDVGGDQSLEDLDMMGNVDIPLSGISISPGDSENIEIEIAPSSAGNYQGMITFKSGGEAAFILVSLNCFENISGKLSALSSRLADLKLSEEISSDIDSDIEQANSAFTLGNYAQANEYTVRAQAKVSVLETTGGAPGQPMDLTWVVIIIVIIVVVIVFLWFFKMRKPKASEFGEETEELESFG